MTEMGNQLLEVSGFGGIHYRQNGASRVSKYGVLFLLYGKICYRTLKVYGLETSKERVSSRRHCKNMVISCWTSKILFYYFWRKQRESRMCETHTPGSKAAPWWPSHLSLCAHDRRIPRGRMPATEEHGLYYRLTTKF